MRSDTEIQSAFRLDVVKMILDGHPEKALHKLAIHYKVKEPDLRVGTIKRYRKVLGVYVRKERRIYVSRSDLLTNPFVILHEFYHHLRASRSPMNEQVENRADSFALSYVRMYKKYSDDQQKT